MASIHVTSSPVTTTSLDLFTVPGTTTQITRSSHHPHNPLISIDERSGGENGVFEFLVQGSPGVYYNFYETYLYLLVSIKNKTRNMGPLDKVGPVNNLFHSLFAQIDVTVNDHMITAPTHTNPYKGYIENMCNYGSEAAKSKLLCQLNIKDTPGHMDDLFTEEEDETAVVPAGQARPTVVKSNNLGLMARRDYFLKHGQVELIGKPQFNLSCQQKYILDGTKIRFTFTRQKDSFCLMQAPDSDFHLFVEDAVLYVGQVTVDPLTVLAHHQILNNGTSVKYPVRSGVVKHFTVPSGLNNARRENLLGSQLPTKLITWFTSAAAATGTKNLNPFNFKSYDLSFFAAYKNGVQHPFRELRPNFRNGKFLRSYYHFLASCGCDFNTDAGLPVKRTDYDQGYAIFAVDFTPNASEPEVFNQIDRGTLRLEYEFANPLPEPINVFVYAEYETLIELNPDRTLRFDNAV
jgi:hypothetical protein